MRKNNPIVWIFKTLWKVLNFTRELLANLLLIIFLLLLVGLLNLVKPQKPDTVLPESHLLVMDISGNIVDKEPDDADYQKLKQALQGDDVDRTRQNNLFTLTQKLQQAAQDEAITGLVLKLDNFTGADLPALRYLGKYLQQFKATHKPIYAISNQYDQKQYYLASYADQIFLKPQGNVALFGLATSNLYYKKLLDNLNLDTYIFRVGTYKSAVEPFLRNDMSAEARSNTARWLNLMWQNYQRDVAKNRQQPIAQLMPNAQTYLQHLRLVKGDQAQYALKQQLVDQVVSETEFQNYLKKQFHSDAAISIYDYLPPAGKNSADTDEIGVIVINGGITDGKSSNNSAGSRTITKQLAQILNMPQIKAVVLRINSPGGSVTASEAIRSAVHSLRQKQIPVVVSMGGAAASGGYWIGSESDYIYADANTLTGSIGIYGMLPNAIRALDKLGVNSDGVTISPLAGNNYLLQPITPEFKQMMQLNIESGYQHFIGLVSQARHLPLAEVERLAQGQVWLGEEALKNHLVDALGDFDDAVSKAAELAKLSHYQLNWFKTKPSLFNALMGNLSVALPQSLLQLFLNQSNMGPQIEQQLAIWSKLQDPQSRYAYCFSCSNLL